MSLLVFLQSTGEELLTGMGVIPSNCITTDSHPIVTGDLIQVPAFN